MVYVINERIIFNNEDGSVRLPGEDEFFAQLPLPASRLLSYFIENNGRNLSRDELLSEVWDKYGLVSSGNNLNNYVSILRRTLSEAGENELIITIPRFGFGFNADVQVENAGITEPDELLGSIVENGVSTTRNKFFLLEVGLILAMVVLMIMFYLGKTKLITSEVVEHTVHLGSLDNCQFYTVNKAKLIRDNPEDVVKVLNEKLTEWRLNCSRPAVVYYFENSEWVWAKKGGVNGSYFVAYCPSGLHDSHCENIALYEYK